LLENIYNCHPSKSIQTTGNGSSWSGVFINNGDWSKCLLYAEEDFVVLRNVPHTATYMYG